MRSGLFTTMWCANGPGPNVMILLKGYQKQTFIRGRLCSQYGGILKVFFWGPTKEPNNQFECVLSAIHHPFIIQKCSKLINRKGVVFHHNNARPHTSLIACQKLLELGWDVLPHPAYLPDLAPSDFYLFCSIQNSLWGITFNSDEGINHYLIQFFTDKDRSFYEWEIMKLTERRQKVIEQNGQYIINWYFFFI